MYFCRRLAAWISRHRPRFVRISNLVRTVQALSVPLKENARGVLAVHYKQGKTRGCLLDDIYSPVPERGIGGTAPVSPEFLTLADWQIVENTGSKLMIQIELGKSPIRMDSPRERPKSSAGSRTKSVWK